MTKKLRIGAEVIVMFHDKTKPEIIDENAIRFTGSGCVMPPPNNNFFIGKIYSYEKREEFTKYYDEDEDRTVSYRHKYIKYKIDGGNGQYFYEENILNYDVKTHKTLCKKFKIKYTKHNK
jgi:hypothetical protein